MLFICMHLMQCVAFLKYYNNYLTLAVINIITSMRGRIADYVESKKKSPLMKKKTNCHKFN